MKTAQRMREIAPFHVMALMGRAKQLEAEGRNIIHMEVGEPDFLTPQPVIEAAQKVLQSGKVFYTAALGLPELRQAISQFYRERYHASVGPERIVITTGASGALMLALGVLVERDAEWLLADPSYPCNSNFIRLLEGKVKRVPTLASDGYQPTAQTLAAHWTEQTQGVLLASPSNPTGTLLDEQRLKDIHALVSARNGTLIVDEIYHGLTYAGDAASATTVSDDIFVINSFSKYFGMTGWRLGWLVIPPAYISEVEKLAQNLYIAPPTLSQHAALASFGQDNIAILEARRQAFDTRRQLLTDGLRELGFVIASEPQGAFYIYADASHVTADSYTFTLDLLEKAGVATTPGIDFGTHEANRYVRFAYTVDEALLREGLLRIKDYLNNQNAIHK